MAEEAEGTQEGQRPEAAAGPAPEDGSNGAEDAGAQHAESAAPAAGPSPEMLLEQARKEAAENLDKHVRLQAEFENYKRRIHKEQSEVLKYAQLPLLRDLAGVVDNLERAIAHARDGDLPDHQPFVEGLELVTKQIGDVFERYGMTRIPAKGEPFDPRKHEAMNIVETDQFPENTVIEEFRPGYALHERIVRPSMVAVSKRPQAASGENPPDPGVEE